MRLLRARLVRERTWHPSQEIQQLANDKIELKLTLTSTSGNFTMDF